MKRNVYPHKLSVNIARGKNIVKLDSLEHDMIPVLKCITDKPEKNRKEDYTKEKKILFLKSYEYKKEENSVVLDFVSAKYASRRTVIDTITLAARGILKNEKDGDEEHIHIGLKFEDDETAVCFYEYNSNGIGFSKIMRYLNDNIKAYHQQKNDNISYRIEYSNIVSHDFLKRLEKVTRIKGVTLTVDQEDLKVSESKKIAGMADISSDVDLMFRPVGRGKGISHNSVKEFFKLYNDKNKKVKRVCVDAEDIAKNSIPLDTDKMKEKLVIDFKETITGEADPDDVKKELFKLCKGY